MARLNYNSYLAPNSRYHYQNLGYLGASCTDAIATYGIGHWGWLYAMTNHNSGAMVKTWGFGRSNNYEGITGGDTGGNGPYIADYTSSGGTLGISTHSAAGANHCVTYHGLNAEITADAAYPFFDGT
tara:strand:- start:732 stop:1112 length:381 start_codon:yes stop_codon:yes gene_type:complete